MTRSPGDHRGRLEAEILSRSCCTDLMGEGHNHVVSTMEEANNLVGFEGVCDDPTGGFPSNPGLVHWMSDM
jgi:hypothetical protein